jgi:hypothetical protein
MTSTVFHNADARMARAPARSCPFRSSGSDWKNSRRPDLPTRAATYLIAPSRALIRVDDNPQAHGGRIDAQSWKHPCDRSAVRRFGGRDRRRANLARGRQHRHRRAEFHPDRTGRVPRMGTLLPAGIRSGLRPIPLLVSSLLVSARNEGRSSGGLVVVGGLNAVRGAAKKKPSPRDPRSTEARAGKGVVRRPSTHQRARAF